VVFLNFCCFNRLSSKLFISIPSSNSKSFFRACNSSSLWNQVFLLLRFLLQVAGIQMTIKIVEILTSECSHSLSHTVTWCPSTPTRSCCRVGGISKQKKVVWTLGWLVGWIVVWLDSWWRQCCWMGRQKKEKIKRKQTKVLKLYVWRCESSLPKTIKGNKFV